MREKNGSRGRNKRTIPYRNNHDLHNHQGIDSGSSLVNRLLRIIWREKTNDGRVQKQWKQTMIAYLTKSYNWPWISPHIVNGASIVSNVGSSRRIFAPRAIKHLSKLPAEDYWNTTRWRSDSVERSVLDVFFYFPFVDYCLSHTFFQLSRRSFDDFPLIDWKDHFSVRALETFGNKVLINRIPPLVQLISSADTQRSIKHAQEAEEREKKAIGS